MKPRLDKRTTLADVARAASVSKATASLALNGKALHKMSVSTRERVEAAAEALQFRPHAAARALVRRRTDVLGVVCTVNPFVQLAHHAFEQTLLSAIFFHSLERGYNPMIYGLPGRGAPLDAHQRFMDGRSDAFIAINPRPGSPMLAFMRGQQMPVVTVCCRDNSPNALWVDSDNEAGIQAALDHLISLGHTRIGYLRGPAREDNVHTRVTSFRNTLRERGLRANEAWILPYTWEEESTTDQLDRLFSSPVAPTALLAWNDFACEHVRAVLTAKGMRVPEDVSLVGFDDMPSASAATPRLTTVRQDVVRIGRAAVDLAVDTISGRELPQTGILCPVELVVRESTGPPRNPGASAGPEKRRPRR